MTRANAGRLRRLLDLRRRQEENTRQQLARSLQKAASLSDEVRQRSEALDAVLRGSEPSVRRRNTEMIAEIAMPAILAARAAEASAHGAAEELRRDWDRALRRVKGLERLDDRQTAAEEEARRRHEQMEIEDGIAGRRRGDDT